MKPISRREFGALMAAGVVTGHFAAHPALAQSPPHALTAAEVVSRIRSNVGVEWRDETVDTVKAGDPATVVTGVATTALATMDVLRRAREAGANLIVTAEPAFYGRADSRTPPAPRGPGQAPGAAPPPPRPDPVYDAKNALIDESDLIVFRLSDHWRARRPDPFVSGLADALGWSMGAVPGAAGHYDVPPVTLAQLATDLKRRLGARGGIRVVGNPEIRVRRAALLPGSTPITAALATLPDADVVVAGEVREWESVEYARDVVSSGRPKALILVGRVLSEEPGMEGCARWLTTLVPEVPVRHIAAGDPYWSPTS
jgi:putative NIF3 family GTP cyclohydrolase 1 type 2